MGAQIVGPLDEDDTAITLAELLTDHLGGYQPPPLALGTRPIAHASTHPDAEAAVLATAEAT